MFSAAELIQALQRRLRLTTRRGHPPGEFPAGWQAWFDANARRPGVVRGAPPEALVAVLAGRPLPPPAAAPATLSRWGAFVSLWRPGWAPSLKAERGLRLAAAGSSLLVHLGLAAFLLWLLYGQPPIPAAQRQGQEVVQVEFIGAGSPEQSGGEQAAVIPTVQETAPMVETSPSVATGPELPQAAAPASVDVPPAVTPPRPVEPAPAPPAAAPEQPLVVTEPITPAEMEVFVLPPPSPRLPDTQLAVPELGAPIPEIADRQVPRPLRATTPTVQSTLPEPALDARVPTVAEREVAAPLRRAVVRPITPPALAAPQVAVPAPEFRNRPVPTPPARPVAASPAPSLAPAAAAPAPSDLPAPRPAAPPSDLAATPPATSAGPQPAPDAPGARPTPRRADDWGDAQRAVAGGERGQPAGLYDADGRLRLGEPPGSASPGMPPGTITEEIADLDRSGTWLKRPPTDYQPSTFDKYWRPSETLLQEWVRRGMKEVSIPIPGTSKKLVCVVSMLGLGGGCGISDPNLNEQPATARPPPDIPFKPELQEDNGSIRPGG